LPKVAQLIRQLPKGTVVEIAGYTDGTGRPSANMKLSQQRANVIRSELIRSGVDPGALVAKGYGVFRLPTQTSKNATFEGRSYGLAANPSLNGRRVEFSISRSIPAAVSVPQ
jgi:outer membrane protein OmpA-like peptidoglycan-associated protein